jgi:ribonuclease D
MPSITESITETSALAEFCRRMAAQPAVTVDTEFMRETTFWPKLCLVQVASADEAWAIDPLAPGIDLGPLFELLRNPRVLKVFHAARQDLEIFFHLMGEVPSPIFDSQVAAMVCGFGDQAGYETLAAQLANAKIDKSSRFTDWSKRPLSERQLRYALDDVTHLHVIHRKLNAQLEHSQRKAWLHEEMTILSDPKTYEMHPENAWLRIKIRNPKPRSLAVLREVAQWREREAQSRDLPRGRVLRDEALIEISDHPPRSIEDLARIRAVSRGFADGVLGKGLIAAVATAMALDSAALPKVALHRPLPKGIGPMVELLKVLLKMKCDEHDVAQKLVASTADLEQIAAFDEASVPALRGWRAVVFGNDALAMKQGRIALAAHGRKVRLVPLVEAGPENAAADPGRC